MKQPVERRHAAILAADVAGYLRLMGADDKGTLERPSRRIAATSCLRIVSVIDRHRFSVGLGKIAALNNSGSRRLFARA